MKYRGVFAALLSASLLASVAAAPQAVAATTCEARDLPLPRWVTESEVRGSSPDGHLVVGSYGAGFKRGAVWDNGVLSLLAEPANYTDTVRTNGINNSGIVVGGQAVYHNTGEGFLYRAFRYQNGAYQYLYTAQGEESVAVGINESGDIIGKVWRTSAPGVRWVAMWPRGNEPRRLYLKGEAVGITDDRRLVMTQDPESSNPKVWVIDGNNGRLTGLPVRQPLVLDNDRVLSYADGPQIEEWTLDGRRTGVFDRGWQAYGRNSAGAVLGWGVSNRTTLWADGVRTDLTGDRLPQPGYYGDITDSGVLIGTYQDASSVLHAARWLCA